MGKLPEYGQLQEKEAFFQVQERINRPEELDGLWQKMKQLDLAGMHVFRGVAEARYKMFSSAQRYWVEREIGTLGMEYKAFIQGLIQKTQAWNHGTIERFFLNFGITPDQTLAYLSYMQHFSVPTTLLDFSRKPFTALFFMADGISQWGTDKEIDNYASLYMVDTNNAYLRFALKMYMSGLKMEDQPKDYPFESFFSEAIMMVFDIDPAMGALNNTRIVNQHGNFCHSNSPDKPLEEHYYNTIQEYAQELMDTMDVDVFEWDNMPAKIGKCWNIHKSLKPYILKRLREEENLTNSFVYPDNLNLAQAAITGVLEEKL